MDRTPSSPQRNDSRPAQRPMVRSVVVPSFNTTMQGSPSASSEVGLESSSLATEPRIRRRPLVGYLKPVAASLRGFIIWLRSLGSKAVPERVVFVFVFVFRSDDVIKIG